MKTLCGDCVYWRRTMPVAQQLGLGMAGKCHRYAPRAVIEKTTLETDLTIWPPRFEHEWCGDGEHK